MAAAQGGQVQRKTRVKNRSAAWFMIAQVSSQAKAFEECVRDCEKGIELDPTFIKVYLRAGKALVHLGRVDAAVALIKKGLETKPDSQELKAEAAACEEVKEALTEASATLAAQNWGEAKQLFDRLGDKMLASLVCKLGLAAAELGLNNPAQALRNTLAAINLDGSSPEAYYLRGEALYKTQNMDQAKKHYQEALRLNPDHARAGAAFKRLRNIQRAIDGGKEAADKREFDEAIELYTKAMDMDESNVGLRSTIAIDRANALLRLKRFEEALEDCNLSIEFGKPTTNAYIIRSMANTSLLKFEEAVRDLEEATSIDPDSGIIKERLKKAQMELRKSKRVDYYKVLGVSETATAHEIGKAYKRKCLEWHPDKHGQDEESQTKAREMFNAIGEAQEILSDEKRRAWYDEGCDKEMIEKRMQQEEMFGGMGGMGGMHGMHGMHRHGGMGGHPGFHGFH